MMDGQSNSLDQWEPCQSGQLRQVVRRLKIQRRNRTVAKSGGLTVLLLVLLLGGGVLYQQSLAPCDHHEGGITCSETKSMLPDYIAGKLDHELALKVKAHLAHCPDCGPLYQKMMSAMGQPTALHHSGCRSCPCPSPDRQIARARPIRAAGPEGRALEKPPRPLALRSPRAA